MFSESQVPWPLSLGTSLCSEVTGTLPIVLLFSTQGQAEGEYQGQGRWTWVGRMGARVVGHLARGHGAVNQERGCKAEEAAEIS